MKKGVIAVVFVIFALVVVVLAVGVLSCFDWWKKHLQTSPIVFWVIAAVLVANMFYTVFGIRKVTIIPLKEVMIFLSAVTFIVLIYTSCVMVVKYLLGLLLGAFLKPTNPLLRFVKETGITLPVLLLITTAVGVIGYINSGIIRVKDYEINVEKPSQNKTITAAVISDTHIGISAHKSTIDTIVEKVNDINPDVVFLLGDIFDENTTTDEMEYFAEKFRDVKSRFGAYYIYGNHDEGAYGESRDVANYIEQAGVKVLADQAVVIGGDITVVGMRSEYDGEGDSPDRVMKYQKVNMQKPVIVLKHEPLGIQKIADTGADISMHGHTHGEQFPLTYLPFSFMNDMMYGIKEFDGLTAFTTQGTGGWGFHFKFPAKSEVAKVTINFGVKD